MAAKKKSPKALLVEGAKVEEVRLEAAARLVTFGPESGFWKEDVIATGDPKRWEGTFIRLNPPPDYDDDLLEKKMVELRKFKPAAIRIGHRIKGKVLIDEKIVKSVISKGVRATVMEMAAESRSVDKKALTQKLDMLLSEAGL